MLVLTPVLTGFEPIPPWEQYGLPPPGIMLSTAVPTSFTPFASNPRPASAPPYERLVLVSSRVHQPMKVRSSTNQRLAAASDHVHCTSLAISQNMLW